MLRNILYTLLLVLLSGATFGQTASIQGTIKDAESKQPLAFVNVVCYQDGDVVTGTSTDFDGGANVMEESANGASSAASLFFRPKTTAKVTATAIARAPRIDTTNLMRICPA